MRKLISNILATTGLSLVILAVIAVSFGGRYIFIRSVFEGLGANLVIHLGLMALSRIECRNIYLETILDISYTAAVLLLFGKLFGWYSSTPIWILVLMAAVIYLISVYIRIFRVREDLQIINDLLRQREM